MMWIILFKEERGRNDQKRRGRVFHFNSLQNVKKNYRILLNKAKGWPFNHNGALSLGHPKIISPENLPLSDIPFMIDEGLDCDATWLKCRFLSNRAANYLSLVEKISPKVMISLLYKILANLYLIKQFYFSIHFLVLINTQLLKCSLNHFYVPAGSLINELPVWKSCL